MKQHSCLAHMVEAMSRLSNLGHILEDGRLLE